MILRFAAAALVIAAVTTCGPAGAQFGTSFPGFVQLPADNFTWIWGDLDENTRRRSSDFDARGGEAAFRCRLTGRLRMSSRMSRSDIRNMENSLATSMAFIQAAAQTMNVLDQRLELDWAELACERPDDEVSADEEAERLDRAVEKAIRDRERRRAREE